MNSLKKVSLICACLGLASCGVKKTEYAPPDIKVDQRLHDILDSLKAGGQPGEIIINGVAVNSDGNLDQRISIEQLVGQSKEKTVISAANLPKFSSDLKRKDDYIPTKFETYLNVGCDHKDDSRVEGLTETKNKPNEFGIIDTFGAAASMVDKVFVCGTVDVNESFAILNANEIYFAHVQMKTTMPLGVISISTDSLILEGKNSILTTGASNSTASFLSAPAIKLNIFEKLAGNGSLILKSVGGNYIE